MTTPTKHSNTSNSAFKRFIDSGIQSTFSYSLKSSIRILNGVSAISLAVFLVYGVVCIFPIQNNPLYNVDGLMISLVAVFFYGGLLLLTKLRFSPILFHLCCLGSIAVYATVFLTQDNLMAFEYILFPASVASMLFFTDMRIIILYSLISLIVFFVTKQFHDEIHPIVLKPDLILSFILNHLLSFILLFVMVNHFKHSNLKQESLLEEQNVKILNEKNKSDELLLNILPHEIAEELKAEGSVKAKSYDLVTVMFTDFKNFKLYPQSFIVIYSIVCDGEPL